MGCHTWFYKKVERTQEEAKQSCLKKLEELKQLYLTTTQEELDIYNYTQEDLQQQLAIINRQIRMVEKNLCQKAVWRHQEESICHYIPEKGFFILDENTHDVFRCFHYPNIKLFSYKDTIDFINNPANKCQLFDNTYADLEIYWKENPNGLISFC